MRGEETAGAAEAFSRQSGIFDQLNESNPISIHLREQFRKEVLWHLKPGSRVLELNCGTGLDAVYFASCGHHVMATDVAEGMVAAATKKVKDHGLDDRIIVRKLSFHDLPQLQGEKFDHIVSNFGGLNCSPDLRSVLSHFADLLHPGGKTTLMIMPRFCPWEAAMALKGRFKTATRRWKGWAPAKVEGVPFTCYYYDPGYVRKALAGGFDLIGLRGVCITVPPEFYLGFAERYPKLFRALARIDRRIGTIFPFNRWCDHYLITLRKKR